ncbi:MAG: tripartite tricarboxylate transporter TctB family protein [Hyphomicrobiaceae bacterium]|nr:tripartite tricarboxylate transporter TctB family protein [Hyphomicrobiaceae bacterium]
MSEGPSTPTGSASRRGDAAERSPLAALLVPGLILVFCAFVAYLTTTFDRVPSSLAQGMQPADYPLFLLALLSLLAIVLAWQEWGKPRSRREPLPAVFWITLGLIAVFVVLAAFVDLFVAFFVFSFSLSYAWGERRLGLSLIIAVLTPAALFFLFGHLLEVRFPRGLLTNLIYG